MDNSHKLEKEVVALVCACLGIFDLSKPLRTLIVSDFFFPKLEGTSSVCPCQLSAEALGLNIDVSQCKIRFKHYSSNSSHSVSHLEFLTPLHECLEIESETDRRHVTTNGAKLSALQTNEARSRLPVSLCLCIPSSLDWATSSPYFCRSLSLRDTPPSLCPST